MDERREELEERVAAIELRLRWARRYNLAMLTGVIFGLVLVGGALRSGRLPARFESVEAGRLIVGSDHPVTLESTAEGASIAMGREPGPVLRLFAEPDAAGLDVQQPESSVRLGLTGTLPHVYLDGAAGRAALTVTGHPELRLRDGARQHAARLDASGTGAGLDLITGTAGTDDRLQVLVSEGDAPRVEIRAGGAEPVTYDHEGAHGLPESEPRRRRAPVPVPIPSTDSPSTP